MIRNSGGADERSGRYPIVDIDYIAATILAEAGFGNCIGLCVKTLCTEVRSGCQMGTAGNRQRLALPFPRQTAKTFEIA
jgi:hypothetical protein